ncbi:SagB/ThcOx family dehydrogenase [Aquabacterium humicola]|uniref:SagB/ThcOx family dehydrogenase n=1 Tax=Aquabacterium humicola TaxID=3237377 RepID=UPI002542B5C2|nr:SagB family peptide dehydrogenase [Rubrivivax pictus]
MPKLLWVALPLLAALAWLALQWLRGRPPSRLALNIGASLLLLAYVGTTAGLGIFWVANQQLPVFDWHYLFGYGTVLLVLLHLGFNFPLVWRWITRRGAARPSAAVDDASARRGTLALLGGGLFAALAFMLGLRHGRSELRLDSAPLAGAGTAAGAAPARVAGGDALALVERFHAFSSHSRRGVLLRAPSVDWGDPPAPFKRYADAPSITLPPPRSHRGAAFDGVALGTLLWHVAGVTEERGTLKLRASPSSGALFSTELYVAVRALDGLAPGLWHYDAEHHALERLSATAPDDAALGAAADPALAGAEVLLLATALFRRSGHKYRDRTYRYVLADLGHALENALQAGAALGRRVQFVHRFDESRAAAALGVDEAEEGVLALLALHESARAPVLASTGAQRWAPPALGGDTAERLGITGTLHRATSLRAAVDGPSASPPASAASSRDGAHGGAIALPQPAAPPHDGVLALIARRRSVRRFASAALPLETLGGLIAGLRTPDPWSAALRMHLVVHAVNGLAAGAYRIDLDAHRLLPRRAAGVTRAAPRAAALDQDVIGDAAAVFMLTVDRAAFAADPAGAARGYRHALLEAGRVGERLYLEAGARGLGVCAVGAFYDEEAAALIGIDPARAWVVHLAALGVR